MSDQPQWMNGGDLGAYLKQQCKFEGIHNIETDSRYMFPSKDYILGDFCDYFLRALELLDTLDQSPISLLNQEEESNDCDDRALLAMSLARARHHKTRRGYGIAFGIMKYEIGGIGSSQRWGVDKYHWLNFGVEMFSWAPVLVKPFFVNMPARRVEDLSPAEIQSCQVRFC
jgi:hypothetical protein